MKFLSGLTLTLTLFGATMAVTLGVVCLIYGIYIDASPKMREEWPGLMWSTLSFTVLMLVSAAAFQALRKNWRSKWPLQAAQWLVVIGLILVMRWILLPA